MKKGQKYTQRRKSRTNIVKWIGLVLENAPYGEGMADYRVNPSNNPVRAIDIISSTRVWC